MNQKDPDARDDRLSIRVPKRIKQAIAQYAKEDRRAVADTANLLLEEIVEIERVRRLKASRRTVRSAKKAA